MSSINSPEKTDPQTPSAFVSTSTHSGNVNFNVVLNRVENQPPSLSSDSDIEVLTPDKVIPKKTYSKKLNTVNSFPQQFTGLSYPLVQSDKWIYSIVPTDSRIVKNIDYPEILNLKLVEANMKKNPILKTIRDAIRDKGTRAKDIITQTGTILRSTYQRFCCARKLFVDGWSTGHTKGHVISSVKPIASQPTQAGQNVRSGEGFLDTDHA